MNEPNVTVAILTAPEIKFELYGNFKSDEHDTVFNGKYSASIENDLVKITKGDKSFTFEKPVTFVPQEYESDSFLLKDVIIATYRTARSYRVEFNSIGSRKKIKDSAAR